MIQIEDGFFSATATFVMQNMRISCSILWFLLRPDQTRFPASTPGGAVGRVNLSRPEGHFGCGTPQERKKKPNKKGGPGLEFSLFWNPHRTRTRT